jgi:hypothetical protein
MVSRVAGMCALAGIALACGGGSRRALEPTHAEAMRDSVRQFARQIVRGLADDGPMAWLRYFETTPAFFMASDGRLVFPSNDSATVFVQHLGDVVSAIDLEWTDLRVEPLAPGIAVVAAAYREAITDTSGATTSFGGFLTGVARHTPDGWRLRNLHWSSPVPPRH